MHGGVAVGPRLFIAYMMETCYPRSSVRLTIIAANDVRRNKYMSPSHCMSNDCTVPHALVSVVESGAFL